MSNATLTQMDYDVKSLAKRYRAHVRWFAHCDAFRANGGSDAGATLNLRLMPGKVSKHHGYDEAGSIARRLSLSVPASIINTLGFWKFVLDACGVRGLPEVPARCLPTV